MIFEFVNLSKNRIKQFAMLTVISPVFIINNYSSLMVIIISILGFYGFVRNKYSARLSASEYWIISVFLLLFTSGLFGFISFSNSKNLVAFGVNLQYLLIVPVFYWLRENEVEYVWLKKAIYISAVSFGLFTLKEVIFNDVGGVVRAGMIYGPVAFGFVSMMLSLLLLDMVIRGKVRARNGMIMLMLSMFAMVMSGTRSSWIAFLVVLFVMAFIYGRQYRKMIFGTSAALVLVLIVSGSLPGNMIHDRANLVVSDISKYVSSDKGSSERATSIGLRIEAWQAAWQVFADNPIFGVGLGDFIDASKSLVDAGLYTKTLLALAHAHNEYLNIMAEQGLIGLVLLLFMHVGLLRFYINNIHSEIDEVKDSSYAGIIVVLSFLVFGLPDAPLTHNNLCAMYLLVNVFIFTLIHRRKNLDKRVDL